MTLPNLRPASYPDGRPGRFSEIINTESPEGCRVALIGLADDTGVTMNNGHAGAAEGPAAIRGALNRFGVASPAGWAWPKIYDAGDVLPGGSLDETHDRVTEATTKLHEMGLLPIALGGGHDLTFPFVRALRSTSDAAPVGVYFDAHLDVREEPGSGMPFRKLVEECGVRELYIHGMDAMANSSDQVVSFQSHGGRTDPFGPNDQWPMGDLFVSFDLDVLDQSVAPGVSAPNPMGMRTREAAMWCYSAGRRPGVKCFDIMELCPPRDENGRTARLAARLLMAFLRGVGERQV